MRLNGVTEQGDFGAANLGGFLDTASDWLNQTVFQPATQSAQQQVALQQAQVDEAKTKALMQKILLAAAVAALTYVAYKAMNKNGMRKASNPGYAMANEDEGRKFLFKSGSKPKRKKKSARRK